MSLKVDLHGVKNFTEEEEKKFLNAMKLLEITLNSEEFKEEVLSYSYYKYVKVGWFKKKKVLVEGFKSNNGKTNQQIYDTIMSGKDKFNKEEDEDIDIFITMFYKNNSSLGYTYKNTFKTWINRKFYSNFKESNIVGNVSHESTHNMGFGHDSRSNSTRKHTVPYAIGYIARNIAARIASDYGMQ